MDEKIENREKEIVTLQQVIAMKKQIEDSIHGGRLVWTDIQSKVDKLVDPGDDYDQIICTDETAFDEIDFLAGSSSKYLSDLLETLFPSELYREFGGFEYGILHIYNEYESYDCIKTYESGSYKGFNWAVIYDV